MDPLPSPTLSSTRRTRTSTRPRRFVSPPLPSPSPTGSSSRKGRDGKGVAFDVAEGSVGGKGDRQTENGEPSKKADGTGQEEEEEEGEPEEDPVWTDFSAEYYEVVEQLPLELHRNFALLRELDDQTQRHTTRLLELIRQYLVSRLRPKLPIPENTIGGELLRTRVGDKLGEGLDLGLETGREEGMVVDGERLANGGGSGILTKGEGEVLPTLGAVEDKMDIDQPEPINAEAGPSGTSGDSTTNQTEDETLMLPIVNESRGLHSPGITSSVEPNTLAFPSRPVASLDQNEADPSTIPPLSNDNRSTSISTSTHPSISNAQLARLSLLPLHSAPHLLPEISRLALEMLRSADEKVGVAQGVYNSVDRHIRALDLKLEGQEMSLNAGIREGTRVSEGMGVVDGVMGAGLGKGGMGMEGLQEEGVMIGMSGSGAGAGPSGVPKRGGRPGRGGRKGNKKSHHKRKREEDDMVGGASGSGPGPGLGNGNGNDRLPIGKGEVVVGQYDLKIDPFEPRYCYCGGYSFGVMIACDASDCPNGGWIHLACQGLAKPPPGAFFCNDCKPQPAQVPVGNYKKSKK